MAPFVRAALLIPSAWSLLFVFMLWTIGPFRALSEDHIGDALYYSMHLLYMAKSFAFSRTENLLYGYVTECKWME
jgi:hypothetical protein